MKNAFTGWRYLWTSQDIRRKLIITLIILVIFRLAANVPVPGINGTALKSLLQGANGSGSFFAFLDLLSGGTISHFSLLAMGVYPYITAQIILQLLTPIFPALQRKMEEDPREGRKWQEKWTYYLAVPMAALSALGQINLFNSYSVQGGQGQIVPFGFTTPALALSSVTLLLTMIGGTMFAIWLGELISEYGIRGQGLSLIIFAGIVARMPAGFAGLLADKAHGWVLLISMVVVMAATIYAIVFVPIRTGHVSRPPGRQPDVHAGERHAAVDGKPGRHDPANFRQCHPAVPGHYCQLLCKFIQRSSG
jgi:preprotein translocase subunit SecY